MIVRLDRGTGPTARYRVVAATAGPMRYAHPPKYILQEEYIPRETLVDSAASLVGKPLVVLHPPDNRLDPLPDEVVGRVVEARVEGDDLVAVVEVHDAETIARIDAGELADLSPGYEADVSKAGVQTARSYHHLGIGPAGWGRCGPECSVQGRADQRAHTDCRPRTRLDAVREANEAWARTEAANGFAIRASNPYGFPR